MFNAIVQQIQQKIVQDISSGIEKTVKGIQIDEYNPSSLVTAEHKRFFYENGYVIIENAVPQNLRNRALRAINRSLGEPPLPADNPFSMIPKIITSCPELTMTAEITDLYRKSPVVGCVQSLIGNQTNAVFFGQIALRFPGAGCVPSSMLKQLRGSAPAGAIGGFLFQQGLRQVHQQQSIRGGLEFNNPNLEEDYMVIPGWEQHWHVDNFPNPILKSEVPNGVENFTMLVGVLLSDADQPLCGNLTVFPGSHFVIQDVLHELGGPEAAFNSQSDIGSFATDPQAESVRKIAERAQPRLQPPIQIRAKAGSVILAHYQLAHTISPNVGANIRYCVYFRVTHSRRPAKSFCPEAMMDIWLEYEGIQEFRRLSARREISNAAAAASSSSSSTPSEELVKKAMEVMSKAMFKDRSQDYPTALSLYTHGIEMLMQASAQATNPKERSYSSELARKYITRAEEIKAIVQQKK